MADAFLQVALLAQGTIGEDLDTSETGIDLSSGHGARFPTTGNTWYAIIWNRTTYPNPMDDPNKEIVLVASRSTDTLTVTRAQRSTSAVAHTSGDAIMLFVDSQSISDLNSAVNDLQAVILLSGTVSTGGNFTLTEVSDSDAQISVSGTTLTIANAGTYILDMSVYGYPLGTTASLQPSVASAGAGSPTITSCDLSGSAAPQAGYQVTFRLLSKIVTTTSNNTFNLAVANGQSFTQKMVARLSRIQ